MTFRKLYRLVKPYDLEAAGALAAMVLVLTKLGIQYNPLWAGLTLLMVFLLPGYTFTELIFSKNMLDASTRILAVLGFSIAIDVLVGFLLNLFPTGLTPLTWAWVLSLVTILAGIGAFLRRRQQQNSSIPDRNLAFSPRQLTLLGLSGIVIAAALFLAWNGAANKPASYFTQLWILPVPGDQLLSDTPAASSQIVGAVQLGVQNQEAGNLSYRVQVTSHARLLANWPSISLKPGQKWEDILLLPQGLDTNYPVEVDLYRLDAPKTLYRHTTLWIGK